MRPRPGGGGPGGRWGPWARRRGTRARSWRDTWPVGHGTAGAAAGEAALRPYYGVTTMNTGDIAWQVATATPTIGSRRIRRLKGIEIPKTGVQTRAACS